MPTSLDKPTIVAAQRARKRTELWDTDVPGLHAVVTESGIATFAIRYRVPGGQRRHRLGRFGVLTVDQARKLARLKLADIARGDDPQAERAAQRRAVADATLAQLVADFYDAKAHELRPATIATYRLATDRLLAWGGKLRASAIGRAALQDVHKLIVGAPKRAPSAGRRGARRQLAAKRGAHAINRELRTIRTVLGWMRKGGKLPQIDRDAIADTLPSVRVEHRRPEFLTVAEIEQLIAAAERHDAACYAATRAEHSGVGTIGTTSRHVPIGAFVRFVLLTGCRLGEALRMAWTDVDLDAIDDDGRKVGVLRIDASTSKTHRDREIDLAVCPTVRAMLAAMRLRAGRGTRLWDGYSEGLVDAAAKRLVREYGAPSFSWQTLRSTCATFLVNSPGIFGSSVATFREARQLGHSVVVAERHYAGALRGIPREAASLEAAMRLRAPHADAPIGATG